MIIDQSDPILVPVVNLEEVQWSQQPPKRQVLTKQKRRVPKLKLSLLLVHQEDDTELIINTEGNIKLCQDFLPFLELADLKSNRFNLDSSRDSDDSLVNVGESSDDLSIRQSSILDSLLDSKEDKEEI